VKIPAPIALFVYNRPGPTRRTLDALRANVLAPESPLYIFSDGPRNEGDRREVELVRACCRGISGFQSVELIERDSNLGLARSIVAGVTELTKNHGSVIVLEDDLDTSPYFLQYMNQGLNLYENDERVISIHGYVYPTQEELPETFFLRGADCWGWATWKRGWDVFEADAASLLERIRERNAGRDFDFGGTYPYTRMLRKQAMGHIDSWAVCWYASAFLKDKLTLYPGRSLVNHIGFGDYATHNRLLSRHFESELATSPVRVERIPVTEDAGARQAFGSFFRGMRESPASRGWQILLHILRWRAKLFFL